jgi:membrane-bound inhibitor of C-type lysozyme
MKSLGWGLHLFNMRFASLVFLPATSLIAGDLTIHLDGAEPVSRQIIEYQCDGQATRLGLPKGPFRVEYINGGGNSLAVLPISGKSLIFANVLAGSGARYAAQQYIWWEAAGRSVSLSSDSLAGKMETTCQRVSSK